MIIIKLAVVALLFFVLFGGALLFTQLRKKKMRESCADKGEHSCQSCSCERF